MKALFLILIAFLAVACAGAVDAPEPQGWHVGDTFTLPLEGMCYEVAPVALRGVRDLPAGEPDVTRVRRPAWGDPIPGGWRVRAWPGDVIEVWVMGDASTAVDVDVMEAPCQ